MSSAYDQQIKELVEHIQTLNQALHERNTQIVHWQQVARSVQDERTRLARALMDQVRQGLAQFATRFNGLRSENRKLRTFIDHQKQLHENVARDLHGQLQYALSRIEELARERAEWRDDVNSSRSAALKYQQQVQEQKGVINSQQAALTELKLQLEMAQGSVDLHEALQAEIAHLQEALALNQTQLAEADHRVAGKEREVRVAQEGLEAFQVRANQEVGALHQQIAELQAQVTAAAGAQGAVGDETEELKSLLANSEREVANLFQALGKEREVLKRERETRVELELRLDAKDKEARAAKAKATKLERASETAKNKQFEEKSRQAEQLQKQLDDMLVRNSELQEQLQTILNDKTQYLRAVEGQKGKLRPVDRPADQGGQT